jgi:hypothetical protein
MGGDIAVFATARKLAVLIYRLLRWGQQYVDEGAEAFEKRCQEIRRIALEKPRRKNSVGNCFTHVADVTGWAKIADTWSEESV